MTDYAHQNDHSSAVVGAVADLLLLAKGRLHVLSHDSGYGRLAAFLSDATGAHVVWGGGGYGPSGCESELRTRTDESVLVGYSGMRL